MFLHFSWSRLPQPSRTREGIGNQCLLSFCLCLHVQWEVTQSESQNQLWTEWAGTRCEYDGMQRRAFIISRLPFRKLKTNFFWRRILKRIWQAKEMAHEALSARAWASAAFSASAETQRWNRVAAKLKQLILFNLHVSHGDVVQCLPHEFTIVYQNYFGSWELTFIAAHQDSLRITAHLGIRSLSCTLRFLRLSNRIWLFSCVSYYLIFEWIYSKLVYTWLSLALNMILFRIFPGG